VTNGFYFCVVGFPLSREALRFADLLRRHLAGGLVSHLGDLLIMLV
jgi:hypothetical protein